MLKLVCDNCKWAVRDKSMIFHYVVYVNEKDIKYHKYIMLDENNNEVYYDPMDYLVDDGY